MTAAVYPGSFNPPTIGHLAIIEAAVDVYGLSVVDLVVSRRALAKGPVTRPSFAERLGVLRASVAHMPAVAVHDTELQLIADISQGYDMVIMGADKWSQLNDPGFYRSTAHMNECLALLPRLAIAARGAHGSQDELPPGSHLEVSADITDISSTGARSGRADWMTPEARSSGLWPDAGG